MKHTFLIVFLGFLSLQLFAQLDTLKIKYTENVTFEIPEHLLGRGIDFPASNDLKKILAINGQESLYYPNDEDTEEEKEDDLNSKGRGFRMRRMAEGKNDVLYQNKSLNYQWNEIEMFDRTFVVKEEIPTFKWKIKATEQRDILGYTCMKAEYQDTSNVIIAWFSPQLPISYGPAGYGGLPGIILALTVGESKVILATEVINSDVSNKTIEKPKAKKELSREEFETLRKEKIEEMKAMWSGRRR